MKKKVIRIILTSVLLLIAWLIDRNYNLPMWQTLIVYFVPYLLISYDVLGEAVEGIMEGNPFDEDLLMSIATIGAFIIGFLPNGEPEFLEGVFVMLFFKLENSLNIMPKTKLEILFLTLWIFAPTLQML